MAAMAQLDCGQCGYLCQTYAEALASGKETSASLCVPGAKPTSKKVKELLADRPARFHPPPPAPESAAPAAPTTGMPVIVLAADRPHWCGLRERRPPRQDRPDSFWHDLRTRRF